MRPLSMSTGAQMPPPVKLSVGAVPLVPMRCVARRPHRDEADAVGAGGIQPVPELPLLQHALDERHRVGAAQARRLALVPAALDQLPVDPLDERDAAALRGALGLDHEGAAVLEQHVVQLRGGHRARVAAEREQVDDLRPHDGDGLRLREPGLQQRDAHQQLVVEERRDRVDVAEDVAPLVVVDVLGRVGGLEAVDGGRLGREPPGIPAELGAPRGGGVGLLLARHPQDFAQDIVDGKGGDGCSHSASK
jgi:hypothetical protein